jgi:hypothetical protein
MGQLPHSSTMAFPFRYSVLKGQRTDKEERCALNAVHVAKGTYYIGCDLILNSNNT